jgi:hypothetical protein
MVLCRYITVWQCFVCFAGIKMKEHGLFVLTEQWGQNDEPKVQRGFTTKAQRARREFGGAKGMEPQINADGHEW